MYHATFSLLIPAGDLTLPLLRERFKTEAPGTWVKLEIVSGSHGRQVALVLRDLV
jgi:hypothetical protein